MLRKTLMKAFSRAEFALRSSKTTANSCASTGGFRETLICAHLPENIRKYGRNQSFLMTPKGGLRIDVLK
jgi:hypothetical protein